MPTRGRRFKDSLRAVKFCPWCGSNDIERDDFNPAAIKKNGEQRDHGLRAWVCNSCFQGYSVRLSPRAEYARYLIRQEARMRPPDQEQCRGYTEEEWVQIVHDNHRRISDEKEPTMKQEHGPLPAEAGGAQETREGEARQGTKAT